jgi:hypothetical protein
MRIFMRWTALLATLVLVLAACGPGPAGSPGESPPMAQEPPTDPLGVVEIQEGDPIHIVFWGVLSGADASLGVDAQRGVEIAIDDRGGQLLGRDIEMTSQDGLCTPEGGATAAQAIAADTTVVGLIGSETKAAKFRSRLKARGVDPSGLVAPIGLFKGGKHPAEVAVSIAAQLCFIKAGRSPAPASDPTERGPRHRPVER